MDRFPSTEIFSITDKKTYAGLGYSSNTAGVLYEAGIAYNWRTLGITPGVVVVARFDHFLNLFLRFMFLHKVSCVDVFSVFSNFNVCTFIKPTYYASILRLIQ